MTIDRTPKFLALLAMGLLGSETADARRQNERAVVEVENIKRDRPTRERPAEGPKSTRHLTLQRTLEVKLIKGISQTINYLQKTVKSMPKRSNSRQAMLVKILNLRLEQATYEALEEQSKYDQAWEAWDRGGRRGREPRLTSSRSKRRWEQVVSGAQGLLREFPRAKNADLILFDLALAQQFLGRNAAAAKSFNQLIKRFPKSKLLGDAFFFLGDHYFDGNQFKKAVQAYTRATAYRQSSRYGWALYKLAWSYFNLGSYRRAINEWKKTVLFSQRMGGTRGERLQEESLRDMIFAFAELGAIEEGIRYFRSHRGEEQIPRFLRLLATTLTDQGKFKKAIAVWKRLVRMSPTSPTAVDAQREIVALHFDAGSMSEMWKELIVLVDEFGPNSSWAQSNPKLAQKAALKNKQLMAYYPKVIHRQAQKSRNKPAFAHAKYGYQLYLKRFPKGRDLAEILEYVGDIDYFSGDYRSAGRLYLHIAKMGKDKAVIFDAKGKVKKNIHQRSAKNMLDSFNRAMLSEFKRLLTKKPNFSSPIQHSAALKDFIDGCAMYAKWYPSDRKTVRTCDTFLAEIYYRTGRLEPAKKWLGLVAKKYPGSKEGTSAAQNLVPLYASNKAEQGKLILALLAIPAYRSGALGSKLKQLQRELQIEQIRSVKEPLKRARMYEAQAKAAGTRANADILWNNAATEYLRAGEVVGALAAYQVIVAKFPKSKAHQASLLQSAKLQDKRLHHERAASFYIAYAQRYRSAKETPGAMQRACALLTAVESSSAVKACVDFAQRFPEGGKPAIERLIHNMWRRGQYNSMNQLMQRHYLSKYRLTNSERVVAHHKQLKGFGARSRIGKNATRQILALAKPGALTGEALRHAGAIHFERAKPAVARALSGKLRGGDVGKLQSSIQALTNAVNGVEKAMAPLFAVQDSFWAVAGFHQIGLAYERFANQMRNPPAIKGAKPEEVKQQLQGSVDQVMAKAKEYYAAGMDTARKYEVYNDYTRLLFNALNRLSGSKTSFDEWVVTPDFLGSEVLSERLAGLAKGRD